VQPRHVALAVVLSVIWGLNFVVIAVGLTGFPPLLMAALRFFIAAIPALFLPRPAVSWRMLIALSFTLFVAQFGLLFPSMTLGMPPGLASIVDQTQAFFTIGIAIAILGERPTARQFAGAGLTLAGLAVIAMTIGGNGVTAVGLALTLASAVFWAIGNVILRRLDPEVDMLPLVSWMALIAVLPLLLLSLLLEGPARMAHAFHSATWLTGGAILYIAVLSTLFGYGAWGRLLRRYPAAVAAPFSLLVPVSGTISAAFLLHETFGPLRLAGMVLIMAGLAVLVLRRRPALVQHG
jgi:O-acetylserine/cysteine efflux transporter